MLEKEGSTLYENLTKKETQMLNRERVKLADQHRGIKDMRRLPDAVIVVDGQYEDTAIREAKRLEIPVIAIVDSNTDPKKVDYPIPANDDSIRTIQLIISALAKAINEARVEVAGKEKKQKTDKKKKENNTMETPATLKEDTSDNSVEDTLSVADENINKGMDGPQDGIGDSDDITQEEE